MMKEQRRWSSSNTWALVALLWLCMMKSGCGGPGDDPPDAGVDAAPSHSPGPDAMRLVPPGDPRFDEYEIPERPGECGSDTDCTLVCTTRCSPVPRGPVTCPVDPDPLPDDLAAADCLCVGAICAFWPAM